jgi:uncharacterized membrane protein
MFTASIDLFSKVGISWILRWWHVVFGVAWIGLLYYFNFVQLVAFPKMEAPHRNGAIDKLVPQALWYFRYAALATALTGLIMWGLNSGGSGSDALYQFSTGSQNVSGAGWSILIGAVIGLIMLANVWLVIWPNQQKIIANARGLLEGKPADPNLGTAPRKALLASRTNAIFSITMLMFMTGTQNIFNGEVKSSVVVVFLITMLIVAVLELSALGFIGGLEGPLTKPLASHKNIAHIGAPLAIVILILWKVLA